VDKFGELFHSEKVPLDYTPHKMISMDKSLIILEYDNRTYPNPNLEVNPYKLPLTQIGQPYAPNNIYAAQVRVYVPKIN
jgi:hypothetical protein